MRRHYTLKQKVLAFLGSWALFLLAFQFGIFAALILKSESLPGPTPSPRMSASGAVVAYSGDGQRITEALDIARRLKPAFFFLTRTNLQELGHFKVKECLPSGTRLEYDLDALTTDGNARAVRDFARRTGVKRVVLVTSWYHVPRAYLLTRWYLRGTGAKLRTLCAGPAPAHFALRRFFWQEYAKMWGSLYRVLRHAVKGVRS